MESEAFATCKTNFKLNKSDKKNGVLCWFRDTLPLEFHNMRFLNIWLALIATVYLNQS